MDTCINKIFKKKVQILTNGTRLNHVKGLYDSLHFEYKDENEFDNNWIGVSVHNANDIFEELNIKQIQEFHKAQSINPDSKEEAELLKILANESQHINNIVKLSNFPITQVNSTLVLLEMKGLVKNLGGNMYIKSMQ